jgi:hypothetical protein
MDGRRVVRPTVTNGAVVAPDIGPARERTGEFLTGRTGQTSAQGDRCQRAKSD